MKISVLDIVNIRKSLGLTQTELAERLGLNLRTVQNYEKGTEIPVSIQKLIKHEFDSYFSNKNETIAPLLMEPTPTYMKNENQLNRSDFEFLKQQIALKDAEIEFLRGLVMQNTAPKKKEVS